MSRSIDCFSLCVRRELSPYHRITFAVSNNAKIYLVRESPPTAAVFCSNVGVSLAFLSDLRYIHVE